MAGMHRRGVVDRGVFFARARKRERSRGNAEKREQRWGEHELSGSRGDGIAFALYGG